MRISSDIEISPPPGQTVSDISDRLRVWGSLAFLAIILGLLISQAPVLGPMLALGALGISVILLVRFQTMAFALSFLLTVGLATRERLFSKIVVLQQPFPIYIVEFSMVVLFALLLLDVLRHMRMPKFPLWPIITAWLVYGMFWLVRSFMIIGPEVLDDSRIATASLPVEIVRDSVMVFYALYFIFFALVARDRRLPKLLLVAIIVSGGFFTSSSIMTRLGVNILADWGAVFNNLFAGIFTAVTWTVAYRVKRPWNLFMYFFWLYMAADDVLNWDVSRTFWLGQSLVFVYITFIATPKAPLLQLRRLALFAGLGTILVVGVGIAYMLQPEMLFRANTANFRMGTWYWSIQRALERPIFGWGFGAPLVTIDMLLTVDSWAPTNDPHNSFIGLFFRLGLFGVVMFVLINAAFYWRCLRVIRTTPSAEIRDVLRAVSAAHLYTLVFGSFNLLLESPHFAFWYWGLTGIGLAVATPELQRLAQKPESASGQDAERSQIPDGSLTVGNQVT